MKALPTVDRACVHSYLPDLIRPGEVVLDLGANRGQFAGAMLDKFNCVVHAMEPVPGFHERLRAIPGVRLHTCCLAPTNGEVEVHVPEEGDATLYPGEDDASSTISVPCVTLEEFIRGLEVTEIALIKLDVEGAELPALEVTPRDVLLRTRQITVEFHDWRHPETADRVRQVKQRLRAIGFYCIRFSATNGDVLFVRRDLLHPVQYAYVAFIARNLRGAQRLLRRQLGRILGMKS